MQHVSVRFNIYLYFLNLHYKKTSVLTTLLLVFYPLSVLEIVHNFGNAYKCTFLTLCRRKEKKKKSYMTLYLFSVFIFKKQLFFTAVEVGSVPVSPMLWCTDDDSM